jgi:nucleotide-binding universal stress UspA family protein
MDVVVAFNESEDAGAAAACAAEIAHRTGGAVHLANAVHVPPLPAFANSHAVEELMVKAEADARRMTEAKAKELAARGVRATAHVRRWMPVDVAIDHAKSTGAKLIAVGRRGSSRLTQLLIGTVSSEIVRLSPVSVLVVHKRETGLNGDVVVGVDGSPHGVRALTVARETFPAARIVACHVEHGQAVAADAVIRSAVAGAKLDPKSVVERPLRGDPAIVLLEELAKPGVSAAVIGPRGLGALEGLLLGSVTEKVLQLAKKPVLVAR